MMPQESSHPLVIDAADSTDLAAIQRITDDRLGIGYFDPSQYLPGGQMMVFAARQENRVVGFLFADILSLEGFRKSHPLVVDLSGLREVLTDPVGFIHVVAVDRAYEKRGIGTALIVHAFDTLFSGNRPLTVITTAWSDNQGVHVGGPLHHNHFRKVGYLTDYWRADSMARGYECPTCGKPPCRCTASIFARTLSL